MYWIPQKHKCPKCGFEMDYSPSDNYKFLPINEEHKPFCYKCLIDFIGKNVPVMEQV